MQHFIRDVKNVPCKDCGVKYPYYVMDFHHIYPIDKKLSIGEMLTKGWGKSKILDELNKCVIVCANCHRERTYGKR